MHQPQSNQDQDMLPYEGQTLNNTTIKDFIDTEYIRYVKANLRRNIPSLVDGFKPCKRKIIFSSFKRNLIDKELKVAQLTCYVAENVSYHHDERNLAQTTVWMAHDFVGGNNVTLFEPIGQFGTRNTVTPPFSISILKYKYISMWF